MKEIAGHPEYKISREGRVVSLKFNRGKELKQGADTNGYLLVKLFTNNKPHTVKVHRLVALAFIPNPENKPQVNHKDGNKQNNNEWNLEWATNGENGKHAAALGLRVARKGIECSFSKLNEDQVLEIRADKRPQRKIALDYNISQHTVLSKKKRYSWKHL